MQQPSETHLRLDATTDKTAISSFALSVIIALILGGLATWLAYWYGRKSFKLTEMSFKVVSQDIQEAAQSHHKTTLELIRSQEKVKLIEIEAQYIEKNIDQVRNICINLLADIERLAIYIQAYIKDDKYNFNNSNFKAEFTKEIFNFRKSFYELKFRLNEANELTQEILDTLEKVDDIFTAIHDDFNTMKVSFDKSWAEIDYIKVSNSMKKLLEQEWAKVKKGE